MIKTSIIKIVNTKSKIVVNSAREEGIHRELLVVFILSYFVI